MGRVSDQIARGEVVVPTVKDGVAAAAVLAKIERPPMATTETEYLAAFIVLQGEAHQLMGDDMYRAFAQALNRNPVMAELARRWDETNRSDPPSVG